MPSFSKMANVVASYDPEIGLHFELQCFIGSGRVHPSPFEGWATFPQIFQRRPDGCRFAIVRRVPLKTAVYKGNFDSVTPADEPEGDYLAWDLLDDTLTRGVRGDLSPPEPLWRSASKDGLIMKALALYDRP